MDLNLNLLVIACVVLVVALGYVVIQRTKQGEPQQKQTQPTEAQQTQSQS